MRRSCGIRALPAAPAGALVAILLVLALPAAGAEAARVGNGKELDDPGSTITSSVESAVSGLLRQAEEIEAELVRTPGDEKLLASLARTRVNAADAMITEGASDSESGVEEIKQQLTAADAAWSEYLKVARKPSPGLATLVAPALFQLAELSSNSQEALKNVKAAVAAQKIVVESRPGKNSWSTLAFYELFAQDYKAADEAIEKAISHMSTKFERESIEKRFKEVEKSARRFGKQLRSR